MAIHEDEYRAHTGNHVGIQGEWRQTWGKPRKRNEEESEQVYRQHHMQNTENQDLYSPRICSRNRHLGWRVVTKATEGNLGERWGGTMRKTGCNRKNCLSIKRGKSWSFQFQLAFALRDYFCATRLSNHKTLIWIKKTHSFQFYRHCCLGQGKSEWGNAVEIHLTW